MKAQVKVTLNTSRSFWAITLLKWNIYSFSRLKNRNILLFYVLKGEPQSEKVYFKSLVWHQLSILSIERSKVKDITQTSIEKNSVFVAMVTSHNRRKNSNANNSISIEENTNK